ncbi:MAG: long-chain fatty acid--CoA ligase, partial [bacterium]|nr:long-chain fatty acid--CoA ligase [bacterium]
WGCLSKNVNIVLVDDKMLFRSLLEFQPGILIAPPNFYYNLYRMSTGSPLVRFLRNILPYRENSRFFKWIARTFTYKRLHQVLGGNTRYLITGMAPIDIHILQHFREGYLDICQIYGQTEIGMIACNKVGSNKLGTVGKPIVPLHLGEDNEIITQSHFPTIASYYVEEENGIKREKLDNLRPTGDVGIIDSDGYLTIKGRKNETIILKSGVKINPALIENKLKPKMPD